MKLDKSVIDRRVKLMEEAGVKFVVNANIGMDDGEGAVSVKDLKKEYDAVYFAAAHQTLSNMMLREEMQEVYILQLIS